MTASISLDTINFMMLLLWWLFLYAFIVFPDEFVIHNIAIYSPNYNLLYLLEDAVLIFTLGLCGCIHKHRLAHRVLEPVRELFDLYGWLRDDQYRDYAGRLQSGSLYDLPLQISAGWLLVTGLLAARLPLDQTEAPPPKGRFARLAPRVLMVAILSLPLLGLWAVFFDYEVVRLRDFRILVTLIAALVLGLFVFSETVPARPQADRIAGRVAAAVTRTCDGCSRSSCRKKSWLLSDNWSPAPRTKSITRSPQSSATPRCSLQLPG